jgi:hypothetical protein
MTDKTNENADGPIKPQVIDLAAEDVTEEKPEAQEAPLPPPVAMTRRTYMWIVPVLVIGAIAGGWIYRGVLASYFPSRETTELRNQIGALEANDKALQDRLNAMVASIDAVNGTAATLDQQIKATQKAFAETSGTIAGYDAKLAASEAAIAALKSDIDSLRNTVSLGGTGGGGADAAALAALGQRIDTLEKDVASLKSATPKPGEQSQSAALSQSLADLKAKIAAGTSFQAEYDRIARMVPAAPGLDVLAQHAAMGLPAAAGLAVELRDLIPALPAAEQPIEESSGYLDILWDGLTSIITIRDIGVADWRTVAEEAAKLAEGGDVTGAIAHIGSAEGAKPAGLTQWRDRAAARLKLEAALEETAGAVLRQITALGGAL